MPAFRFVHAADIHLDSPLRSLALRDPELADLIGAATRRVFVRIVDLCLEEQVQALLLSGDLYDGDQTSMKTARFLADELRRLHAAGVKVFVIRGNHDALSKITKELVLPDSLHLFSGRADAVEIDRARGERPVVVHGLSFSKPQAPDGLLDRYRPPVEGAVNIGLMHTSLGGAPGHDVYAPCSAAALAASGFRYWALGHIHKRSATPGGCAIVMPGIPQGRDIGESGAKSVTLVSVLDDGEVVVEERTVSLAQFERVPVDVAGVAEWSELAVRIEAALGAAAGAAASEHLVARLEISGSTPLAWTIRRDADLLRAEAQARATAIGRTWIDKLEIDVERPELASAGATADPIEELRSAIGAEIAPSAAFAAEAGGLAGDLFDQLPPEVRRALAPTDEAYRQLVDRLAQEGAEDVLARLAAAEVER